MSEIEWADKDDGDGVYESHNLGRGSAFWIERDRYGHKHHNRERFRLHCGDSYLGDWRDTLEETKALAQSIEDLLTPDSPAVSPVPPTATDLISREAAIEALETWIANQPDGHYFGAWADAIYEAQKILETLPASAPPVAPTEIRKLSACSLHGVAGCWCSISAASPAPSVGEETNREWRDRNFPPQIIKAWLDGETVGTWQLVEQLKAWAHAWENESRGAAPSVGELEWELDETREGAMSSGYWHIIKYAGPDTLYGLTWSKLRIRDDECWQPMGEFYTPEAAKSLANSLQRILSGAAE